MWAVGRTVSASSSSDVQDSLQKCDSEDEYKERLFLKFVEMLKSTPAEISMHVVNFYGTFPDKTADAEKMRLYLANFTRLAEKMLQDGASTAEKT